MTDYLRDEIDGFIIEEILKNTKLDIFNKVDLLTKMKGVINNENN